MHNAQATLGRRIQEGRKAAGLSQEALGEQLHVSRQAVSKWEADAAIPELENLIAMSRIFGMTVGQLLGVEPEQPEAAGVPEQNPENGGLTEKELAAAEAIAAKYAETAQRCRRPQWSKRGRRIAAAVTAVLALTAGLLVKRQLDAFDQRFREVQREINRVESSVSSQVASLTAQMSNILDEKNSILSSFQTVVTDFDGEAQTVTLRVTAAPKEWTDTTTASFTAALSDGRQFTAEAEGQNGSFTAEGFVVPMDHAIQLSVTLLDGGSARTGGLETLYDCLPGNFTLLVDCSWAASWQGGSKRVTLSDLNLRIEDLAYSLDLIPTAVDLCLYRNRETEPEQVFPVLEAVSLFQQCGYVQMLNKTGYQTSFELAEGDTVVTAIRITDDHGQTTCTPLDAYRLMDDGSNLRLNASVDSPLVPDGWQPGDPIP